MTPYLRDLNALSISVFWGRKDIGWHELCIIYLIQSIFDKHGGTSEFLRWNMSQKKNHFASYLRKIAFYTEFLFVTLQKDCYIGEKTEWINCHESETFCLNPALIRFKQWQWKHSCNLKNDKLLSKNTATWKKNMILLLSHCDKRTQSQIAAKPQFFDFVTKKNLNRKN